MVSMSLPTRARRSAKAVNPSPDVVPVSKQSMPWHARFIWAVITVVFLAGIGAIVNTVRSFLPHSKVVQPVAAIARYPSDQALSWGLTCARIAIGISPADSSALQDRSDRLSLCLDPDFQTQLSSAAYADESDPATRVPLQVGTILPVSMTPLDATHGVALYVANVTGDRDLYYSVQIFAADATHFLMQGIPALAPPPATSATPPPTFESDPELVQVINPRLDNFFEAYLTNNIDALTALTVDGKKFKSPIAVQPNGASPYRGVTDLRARLVSPGVCEAIAYVRVFDPVTQIITAMPYRVILTRKSSGNAQWLVQALPDTPTS